MRIVTTLIASLLFSVAAFAQTQPNTEASGTETSAAAVKSSLGGSMHEIIGRADSDFIVLHLNKETGEVKYLSADKYFNISREETSEDVQEKGKINYQIIMTSNSVYLMNVNTGTTWYMKSIAFSASKTKFVLLSEKR